MTNKCRARGGVEHCASPNCPEKQARLNDLFATAANPQAAAEAITAASWLDPDTILFKTVHGSKLYGTDHPGSDEDYWIVRPTKRTGKKKNIRQTIADNQDVVELDFATFASMAADGVPQALEAMFSNRVVTSHIDFFRSAFLVAGPEVRKTYARTIKNFALNSDVKLRRHAVRLTIALDKLMTGARFNPTLTAGEINQVKQIAALDDVAYHAALQRLSPIELDLTPKM